MQDPTEFRERFKAYKEGKKPYENGLPVYLGFKSTLPPNQKNTPEGSYRTQRYWELNGKPKTFGEAIGRGMYNYDFSDNAWHANSVTYNEGTGNYEFMKPNWHSTKMYEDAWYYGKDGEEFRNLYTREPGVAYDKYVPRKKNDGRIHVGFKNGKLPRYGGGLIPYTSSDGTLYNINPNAVGSEQLNVTTPEIVVTGKDRRPLYQRYDAKHSAYDRATVDEFVRLVDPTGVLSIPQLINSSKHLLNDPSLSNATDFGLSMLSTSPLVGKYSRSFSKLAGYNNLLRFQNIISSPVRMPLKWLAKDNAVDELSRILSGKFLGKNTRINTPILLSRILTLSDPDLMYYGARHSSGEPFLAYRGHKFTGSYDYSNDRTKNALSDRYAGDAANDDRDLVKAFVYGEALPHRMKDSLGIRRYKGYIAPTVKDTIYLDPSYKSTLDSLIKNNTITQFNEQFLRKDGDPRFSKLILDNVKRGLLKFNKDEDQYYANLSDLWDLGGSTFFVGDMFLNRVIDNGGGPFFLEQNSPIKFTKDSRNDILPTIAPKLSLYRNKYNNVQLYKDGKSPIRIKPENRGKLTRLKKRTGKSESELYNDGNPAHKKMVVFARNARKWKH